MGSVMIMKLDDTEEVLIDRVLAVIPENKKTVINIGEYGAKVEFCDIRLDMSKRIVEKAGNCIHMTSTEFNILSLLAKNPGRVFSRCQIYDFIWDEPSMGNDTIIMTHIRHIRQKIEDDPSRPVYIQTVRGAGYRFNSKLGSGREDITS